jgi:hypothetical protein
VQSGLVSDESEVPGLSRERGLPLAKQVEEQLVQCHLGSEFARGVMLDQAGRAELEELGSFVSVVHIPSAERDILVSAILPEHPSAKERPRLATYTALLHLADQLARVPQEKDLLEAALLHSETLPNELHRVLDGWTKYCARDLIAAAHEAVLREVIRALETLQPEAGASVLAADVIQDLIGRVDDQSAALRELELLNPGESPHDLTFRQVFARVERLTAQEPSEHHGLRGWQGRLHELTATNAALSTGAGAASVLPVAWALAVRRAELGAVRGEDGFQLLSQQGWGRVGLYEVIIPSVQMFLREDWPFSRVAAELARRSVEQHLRISWTRMAADPRRDVAVLTSDGDRWSYRKDFYAGRTASRIREAVGWLHQLGLVSAGGITDDGRVILARSLKALRGEGGS